MVELILDEIKLELEDTTLELELRDEIIGELELGGPLIRLELLLERDNGVLELGIRLELELENFVLEGVIEMELDDVIADEEPVVDITVDDDEELPAAVVTEQTVEEPDVVQEVLVKEPCRTPKTRSA